MPELVAVVERAALRAPLDQMPRHSSAALAGRVATPGLLVLVQRVPVAVTEHLRRGTPRLAALAESAARVRIAALAALAAVAVLALASVVALALRVPAALVASAARAVPASMRAL